MLHKRKMRRWLDTLKNLPCMDCGSAYPPYVMHFDHVKKGKKFNVSEGISRGYALTTVLAEIAKCELICANCHAERTHNRQDGVAQR